MNDTIVTEIPIVSTIVQIESNTIVETKDSEVNVVLTPGAQGPQGVQGVPGPNSLSALTDVDISSLQNSSLLIYNEQTQKWTASVKLENQVIDAGHY